MFRLTSTVMGDLKTMYEKLGTNEVDQSVVAEVIGHKSANSGAFLSKVASMRDYGLIDGRGKIRITEVGEKIAFSQNDQERNDAMIRAVRKIPLWNLLFDKYAQKGIEPPAEDFWLELKNLCELTVDEAKKLAPTVLQAYKDDFKFIKVSPSSSTSPMAQQPQGMQAPPSPPSKSTVPDDMIDIGYGDIKVLLPKENTSQAWAKLKAMVEAFIKA